MPASTARVTITKTTFTLVATLFGRVRLYSSKVNCKIAIAGSAPADASTDWYPLGIRQEMTLQSLDGMFVYAQAEGDSNNDSSTHMIHVLTDFPDMEHALQLVQY